MSLKFSIELDLKKLQEQQKKATDIISQIGARAQAQAQETITQVAAATGEQAKAATRATQAATEETSRKVAMVVNKTEETATAATKRTSRQIKKSTDEIGEDLRKVGSLAKKAFAGIAAAQLVQQVISVRTQMDGLERSFVSLTQSAEKGARLTEWIKDFAAATPLSVGALSSATQTMLGFGIAAEDVTKYLRAIGDISMGDAGKMQSLALAFSQMSATGKLMGQDLLNIAA